MNDIFTPDQIRTCITSWQLWVILLLVVIAYRLYRIQDAVTAGPERRAREAEEELARVERERARPFKRKARLFNGLFLSSLLPLTSCAMLFFFVADGFTPDGQYLLNLSLAGCSILSASFLAAGIYFWRTEIPAPLGAAYWAFRDVLAGLFGLCIIISIGVRVLQFLFFTGSK